MGKYHLKSHMFAIEMSDFHVFLGAYLLCTLGLIMMDFKDLYMTFAKEGKNISSIGLHLVP